MVPGCGVPTKKPAVNGIIHRMFNLENIIFISANIITKLNIHKCLILHHFCFFNSAVTL